MTLVVAHADQDICFMVGDTLLSHESFELKGNLGPVNGEFHSLKVLILSGDLAVGFAGNFDAAYSAIKELKLARSQHPSLAPADWLLSQNISDADFLVLINSDAKRLLVVQGGNIREANDAHIGSPEEWQRFCELKGSYNGPERRSVATSDGSEYLENVTDGEKEFDVVSDAMEALSRDTVGRKQPAVGAISGCIVRVVDARISKSLEYMQSVETSNFPWEPKGGYTLLASNEPERGIGIYFRAGERGFILQTCGEAPCVASYAKNLQAFIQEANDRFDMKLVGGTWNDLQ